LRWLERAVISVTKSQKKRIVENSFFPSAIAIDPTVENFARVGVKGFARLLLEGCQPNRSTPSCA
jgi:hypothetical protein